MNKVKSEVIMFSISLVLCILTIRCSTRERSLESKINDNIVDGDTALYSFIAKKISNSSLDSLCSLKEKIVIDLTLSIKEDTIETVHFNGAYIFDLHGNLITGFSQFKELSKILKEATFKQFPQYIDSSYGDYGLKVEFSRFCKKYLTGPSLPPR